MPQTLKQRRLDKVVFGSDIKVLDDDQMIIDHCISDDQPDRVNDDISLDGWDLDNFMANPVVLDIHDYGAPPIGKAVEVYKQGNQLRAKTQFAPTERGKLYFELYKGGFMRAFSVGFMALEYEAKPKNQGYHFTKQELLEYSVVPVPCNPRALKSAKLKIGAAISKANRDLITQAIGMLEEAEATLQQQMTEVRTLLQQVLDNEDDDQPDETNPTDPDAPGDTGEPVNDSIDPVKMMKDVFGIQ